MVSVRACAWCEVHVVFQEIKLVKASKSTTPVDPNRVSAYHETMLSQSSILEQGLAAGFGRVVEEAAIACGRTMGQGERKAGQPQAGLTMEGEHDWVLQHKVGALMLAIIISGRAEG